MNFAFPAKRWLSYTVSIGAFDVIMSVHPENLACSTSISSGVFFLLDRGQCIFPNHGLLRFFIGMKR